MWRSYKGHLNTYTLPPKSTALLKVKGVLWERSITLLETGGIETPRKGTSMARDGRLEGGSGGGGGGGRKGVTSQSQMTAHLVCWLTESAPA